MVTITDGIIFCFFLGISGLVAGFGAYRKKMMIQNTPTSKIRSIAMGLVEIFGKVVPKSVDGTIISPLTEQKCVYYKYLIEELRRSGKRSHWVTIRSGIDGRNFYMQDSTGEVLVNSEGAEIDIPKSFEYQSNLFKDPPKNIIRFLSNVGIKHESFFGINKTLRFSEFVIKPSMSLYVMGTAGDNPYKDEATAKNSVEDVMIQKGKAMFYISDKSEKHVLSKMNMIAGLGLIGGPILLVVGIFLILI